MERIKFSFKWYFTASLSAIGALLFFTVIAHETVYHGLHFLASARISIAIVTNFLFMSLLGLSRLFILVFLGRLRDLEIEQVLEAGRGFLMDTVMFLVLSSPTIDDEEVQTINILQYVGFVVALKLFHLITQSRVAHFFESGSTQSNSLNRLLGLMLILVCIDSIAICQFFFRANRQSSLYLWLLFECLGMGISAIANLTKFTVHFIDSEMEGGWPGTSACIFFLDVVNDILSLLVFLIFMIVFIASYPSRLPIHMTSDIVLVARTLYVKLRSFQRYRQLVNEMGKRFPEASLEELNEADTCIICRDLLYEGSRKLPCSHIFHVQCLKAWFVQQQSCPTCRADVFNRQSQSSSSNNFTPQHEGTIPSNSSGSSSLPTVPVSEQTHTEPPSNPPSLFNTECFIPPIQVQCDNSQNSISSTIMQTNQTDVHAELLSHTSQCMTRTTQGTSFLQTILATLVPTLAAVDTATEDALWHPTEHTSIDETQQRCCVSKKYPTLKRYCKKRQLHIHETETNKHYKKTLTQQMNQAIELSEFFRLQSLHWLSLASPTSEMNISPSPPPPPSYLVQCIFFTVYFSSY